MIKTIQRWIYKTVVDGFFSPDCSNYNSLEVRRTCRTKAQGRDKFKAHNIPHAQGLIFLSPFTALRFVKQHGFPVVIKPNLSSFSRGSFFPIKNYWQLWKAMILARIYWPWLVVEEYVAGKNYRITVFDGEVIAASERFEPYVDGDGESTISELMIAENKIRKKMRLYPVMHELLPSKEVIKHLKSQKLNLKSVPKKGERVKLFYRIALSPGGIVKNLDLETVTAKNKQLAIKILDAFEARIFGIDLIMEQGLDVDWDQQKTVVLEVNSRPYMKLHEYPRYGEKPDFTSYYDQLDSLEVSDTDVF